MLFDFDFGIEIYVPAAKRKRGYYVLPILSGDRLIGSADVKFDRHARRLVVQKLLFEEGFAMTAAVQRAIVHGVTDAEVRVTFAEGAAGDHRCRGRERARDRRRLQIDGVDDQPRWR